MDAIDEKVFFGVNILLPCSCVWSHVIVVAHDHKSRTMFNFCGRVKWPVIGCDLHRNSHIIPLDRACSRKNVVGSQELTMSCTTIPEAVLFSQIRAATLRRVELVLKPRKKQLVKSRRFSTDCSNWQHYCTVHHHSSNVSLNLKAVFPRARAYTSRFIPNQVLPSQPQPKILQVAEITL